MKQTYKFQPYPLRDIPANPGVRKRASNPLMVVIAIACVVSLGLIAIGAIVDAVMR